MPRIKHRGHTKRDAERPLNEWELSELKAELRRLEADPGELRPWFAFKRKSDINNELCRREVTRARTSPRHPARNDARPRQSAGQDASNGPADS